MIASYRGFGGLGDGIQVAQTGVIIAAKSRPQFPGGKQTLTSSRSRASGPPRWSGGGMEMESKYMWK